uniref:Ig-like domain-containing protein n=1 Tax=Labrus bergylta TaxID=56723 RepID=A0A3Q3E5K3_9LABR
MCTLDVSNKFQRSVFIYRSHKSTVFPMNVTYRGPVSLTDTKAHETETVTLEVELNQANVEGSWTRDGAKLKSGGNCRITALGKKHALTFSSLKKEDAGTIVFQAEGVHISSKLLVTGKGCVLFNDVELKLGKNIGIHSLGRKRSLVINKCTPEDAGTYICRTSDDNTSAKLTVHGSAKLNHESAEVNEGEACSFECILSRESTDECSWTLNGKTIKNGDRFKITSKGRKYMLTIKDVTAADAGEVAFNLKDLTAPVLFKKELESQEATDGDKAVLSCETSKPDCKVTWLKGSTVLTHGEKYNIEQKDTTHTLVIHKLDVKDSGEYTCDTGDKRSTASLTVKGNKASIHFISVSFPRLVCVLPEVHLIFGETVTLACTISDAKATVTWMRNNTAIQAGLKYDLKNNGAFHQLRIHNLQPEDSGTYTCDTGDAHSKTFSLWDVFHSISKDAVEGDAVTLHCELSKPGVRVEWRKGGMVLQPSKKYEMKQEGCVEELCIRNLEPEDSGYYTCDAGDQLTTASLAVQGSHLINVVSVLKFTTADKLII